MEAGGPAWLMFTVPVIGLITAVIAAITAIIMFVPAIIERRNSGRVIPESLESAVVVQQIIAQQINDVAKLIQSAIGDLQARVRRLETMQVNDRR